MHNGSRIVRVYMVISSDKESKARQVEATWTFHDWGPEVVPWIWQHTVLITSKS